MAQLNEMNGILAVRDGLRLASDSISEVHLVARQAVSVGRGRARPPALPPGVSAQRRVAPGAPGSSFRGGRSVINALPATLLRLIAGIRAAYPGWPIPG